MVQDLSYIFVTFWLKNKFLKSSGKNIQFCCENHQESKSEEKNANLSYFHFPYYPTLHNMGAKSDKVKNLVVKKIIALFWLLVLEYYTNHL